MKALLFMTLTFFAANSYAQTECEKKLDDARVLCQASVDACDEVKECLVRRDTCVDGIPKTEQACNALDRCMQDNKHALSEHTRCDYTWAVPSSGDAFCRVKKHFLFSEEACPGRIHGFLNAFAYGLDSTVDSSFNCESVVKKRDDKVKTCNELISEASRLCGQVPDHIKSMRNSSCEYAQRFTSYRSREFALDSVNSLRVNDTPRRSGGNPSGTAPASGSTNSGAQR
mgnify:CR=1 FL=1|tara:strand:- start:5614 stop:6297 length:684 start_codon:yes stop_codon:yes gene_type:complete